MSLSHGELAPETHSHAAPGLAPVATRFEGTRSGLRPVPDNETRFAQLIQRFRGVIRSVIRRTTPNWMRDQWDDIEQEIHVRLWEILSSNRSVEFHAGYVRRVARNLTIDIVRSARSRRLDVQVPFDDVGEAELESASLRCLPDACNQTGTRELLEQVCAVAGQMLSHRRRSVGLYLRGFNHNEVSELLRVSPSKARNDIYRGLSELRQRLKDCEIEPA